MCMFRSIIKGLGEVLEGFKHQRVHIVDGIAIRVVNDGEVVTVVINVGVTEVGSFKDNHLIMKKNIKSPQPHL